MWNDFISQHLYYNASLYGKNRAKDPIVLFAEGICMDEYSSRLCKSCSNLGGVFESFTVVLPFRENHRMCMNLKKLCIMYYKSGLMAAVRDTKVN